MRRLAALAGCLLVALTGAVVTTTGSAGPAGAASAGYTALNPARLLDTRSYGATTDGQSQATGAVGPASAVSLQVTGRGGVPSDGVDSVVLNVTATEPTSNSFVTVYPTGSARPNASNLNVVPGQTVPNLVIAKVGAGGKVDLYNDQGNVHLIADVLGYFPTGSGYTGLSPARLLDTRPGFGTADGQSAGSGAVGPAGALDLSVLGRGGVPGSGVDSVVLNVTATDPTANSFITVYPASTTRPNASNLNVVPGQTVPNLVIAKVGAGGKVTLYNNQGSVQLIADVLGWLPLGSDYNGLAPARLLDTRSYGTTTDGQSQATGAVPAKGTVTLKVTGRGNVPASGVVAVVLNVTATEPTSNSFVTVYPTGSARPNASNLNVVPGQTVPNLVIAKVGAGGQIDLYNDQGNVHLIADVLGYLAEPSGPASPATITDMIAAGSDHTCAIVTGGVVKCWGSNGGYDLGKTWVGSPDLSESPVTYPADPLVTSFPPGETPVRIAAGGINACVVTQTGKVFCWGSSYPYGTLGTQESQPSPQLIDLGGLSAKQIAMGEGHACALLVNGTVRCWGWSRHWQLGVDPTTTTVDNTYVGDTVNHDPVEWVYYKSLTPRDPGLSGVTSIASGYAHTCALGTDGTVTCWGRNDFGQLGDGTTNPAPGSGGPTATGKAPVKVAGITTATGVFATRNGACAQLSNGSYACWGDLTPQEGPFPTPQTVPALKDAVSVGGAQRVLCGVFASGTISCAGQNDNGQLGRGLPYANAPLSGFAPVVNIADGSGVSGLNQHLCAVRKSGQMACWGLNTYGQIGVGDREVNTPFLVEVKRYTTSAGPMAVPGITGLRQPAAP